MTKPFLKWAGSKRALAETLLLHAPDKIENYFEPFLGAGAFFIYLKDRGFIRGRSRLSDINGQLVNCWTHLGEAMPLLAQIAQKPEALTQEGFLEVRATQPDQLDPDQQAARFIYLNRTCFNGLYRENKKGEFNVPWGKYKNPKIYDELNLEAVRDILSDNVEVRNEPFHRVIEHARKSDFVYFDPPYVPLTKTSNFTSFSKDGFTEADQRLLRAIADKLASMGVNVLASNSDTELSRDIWKDWNIFTVEAPRSIAAKGDSRKKVREILVRNY